MTSYQLQLAEKAFINLFPYIVILLVATLIARAMYIGFSQKIAAEQATKENTPKLSIKTKKDGSFYVKYQGITIEGPDGFITVVNHYNDYDKDMQLAQEYCKKNFDLAPTFHKSLDRYEQVLDIACLAEETEEKETDVQADDNFYNVINQYETKTYGI